ncbi:MAG: glutathione peroxidase [Hahellaceae bacterium]|nr:glutathione peroxidase [Hahellaceae bacterium]MCP5212867.1 glutathione peroxidase [Hahellaceae bacterium]
MTNEIYNIDVKKIDGNKIPMSEYKGKVLLIVNTASKCGFTPQFKGLEKLYEENKDLGLEILGFPCNQFMNQDPGNEQQISEFCSLNYGVSFPMFAKVEVNGDNTHPLYKLLKSEAKGVMGTEKVKWNFTKFLVGRDGQVVKRYAPNTEPAKIAGDIKKLL